MSLHPRVLTVLLIGMALALSACTTGLEVDAMVHESQHGAVYVERIGDRSFQAAHPITLPPETMIRVLRGVVVKDNQGLLRNLVAGKPEAVRVFGDQDVEYLAPLLVEGLRRAASDQQVGFRLVQTGAPTYSQSVGAGVGSSEPPLHLTPLESTKGSIYAYGRSLYLTLTEYRHRPERAETINMANRRIPDQTGLVNHTVHFVPESAKRPDTYRDARSTDYTLVIDYDTLASLPAAPEVRPTADQPPTPAKGEPSHRDTDMEALRKELQDIKKKLAEQEAERARSLPSPSPNTTPRSTP